MIQITEKQLRLCEVLRENPRLTRKRLGELLGKSPGSINQMLERMERRGIVRIHRGWYGIELVVDPFKEAA